MTEYPWIQAIAAVVKEDELGEDVEAWSSVREAVVEANFEGAIAKRLFAGKMADSAVVEMELAEGFAGMVAAG